MRFCLQARQSVRQSGESERCRGGQGVANLVALRLDISAGGESKGQSHDIARQSHDIARQSHDIARQSHDIARHDCTEEQGRVVPGR